MTQQSEEDRTRTLWKYPSRPSGFPCSVCSKKPPARRYAVWGERCRYPVHDRDRRGRREARVPQKFLIFDLATALYGGTR